MGNENGKNFIRSLWLSYSCMYKNNNYGIVYIATGSRFVREATISAKRVKALMPDVSLTLFTDKDTNIETFDNIFSVDNPRYDFGDQVYNLDRTPYERTIFFDSDIYIEESIRDVFDILDEFDVAASHDIKNYSSARVDSDDIDEIPDCFSEYNSGVFAFKYNSRVKEFFEIWKKIYTKITRRGQIHNQAAFRYALYHSDTRIATLPQEYNCLVRDPNRVHGKVRIFHGRLIDIETPGAKMYVDIEQAAEVINSRTDVRMCYRVGDKVKLMNYNIIERIQASVSNKGIIGTLNQVPGFVWQKIFDI